MGCAVKISQIDCTFLLSYSYCRGQLNLNIRKQYITLELVSSFKQVVCWIRFPRVSKRSRVRTKWAGERMRNIPGAAHGMWNRVEVLQGCLFLCCTLRERVQTSLEILLVLYSFKKAWKQIIKYGEKAIDGKVSIVF